MNFTSAKDFKIFFVMIVILVLPATLTLLTIEKAQNVVDPIVGVSPLGYTWSLLLFIVPALAIITWLYINHDKKFIRKSFWLALFVLIPLGFTLDIFFGLVFFTFTNHEATLQIYLPGFDFSQMHWRMALPLEEFVFYLTGFIAVLLIYIWCDEYWLAAYNVPDYSVESKKIKSIMLFHPQSLMIGLALIISAIIYKNFYPHPYQGGLPGYFIFLVVASFVPSMAFFKTTYRFINWRAFSATFFFILLISLLWEVTLASPYQWWGYNYDQMLGITIGAWTSLPIEAVLVWMAVTFTTVIIYEAIKIWISSGKPIRHAFLGRN
jgi:hypothetical protein